MWMPQSTRSQNFALLDSYLMTVETIWVKWTHGHVQETSLISSEPCDMACYPAGSIHQKWVHYGQKWTDMVTNNIQVRCGF